MDSPVSADGCNTPSELQVACGPRGVSPTACHNLGCCFNHEEASCSYRLNASPRAGNVSLTKRELVSDPDTALVSLGPIVLVQTEATVQSRGQTESPKYSTVSEFLSFYSLSAVCSAAVFFLVFSAAAAVLCRGARKGRGLAERVAVETGDVN
ncbi:UNVERIFIED_CONTAM: hypothetical protein FKN15_027300 [Acipenser sinensis]